MALLHAAAISAGPHVLLTLNTKSLEAAKHWRAAEARAATAQFDEKTALARSEIYKQMDEMRKAAQAERAETLARTRAEAEAEVAQAAATLKAEADEARRRLAADAETLGAAAADRILGRRAS